MLASCREDIVKRWDVLHGALSDVLELSRRLASPAQRIVLYAKDRGCSQPGCDVPGYLTEVHHVRPWWRCRETDIDELPR